MTDGEKRDVWRLTVENVSAGMKPEEKEKEENMYRDVSPCPSGDHTERMFFIALVEVSDVTSCVQLYSRHKDYLSSLVGQDFEMVTSSTNYQGV